MPTGSYGRISPHDALTLQQVVVRAMHTAAAEVEDEAGARQLDGWADNLDAQIADALDAELCSTPREPVTPGGDNGACGRLIGPMRSFGERRPLRGSAHHQEAVQGRPYDL